MKSTTRGTLAAVLACMASAVGAAPAAASTTVPVRLPLEALETVFPIDAPELSTGIPVPVPGPPDGPHPAPGRLLPERLLPQVPFTAELPETVAALPLEHPLQDGRLGVATLASAVEELRLTTPGLDLGAPLSPPRPELLGQPEPVLPQAGLLTPTLTGAPGASLLFG
ncbi:hypothetical protein I3J09_09350 [Streptomyces clavuligerus]|uniref:hypothetical protein n=1 Tax=Streptomyces clavuligerus TaxID=1901 RepID=UPI00081050DC|nr:hypothetical protein [Streptomyces clavuligerus]ANW18403.1 hypothetical protein BB341_09245 [Streptomyces clavuligerus]AXU12958.1 hypothetical protein D1794_09575 [Streptomyces clavuligerus]QPL63042.1 hypothetical protein I3J04_09335 [Streptomyces clavuligerus]QPL69068.1 hypothetical protein I3J05_09350 [Streptomyces clavuligerus]QPL75152.1 hypothetical protein I3J06_09350 [Streptomyces clavuligerus]